MPKQDRRQIYPKFSKKEINKAASNLGRTLKENGFISASDEDIVENWRASHTHILNT